MWAPFCEEYSPEAEKRIKDDLPKYIIINDYSKDGEYMYEPSTEPELCVICKKRESIANAQYCAECEERYLKHGFHDVRD